MTGQNQEFIWCPSCGFQLPRYGPFCPKCGKAMPPKKPDEANPSASEAQPRSRRSTSQTALLGSDVMAKIQASALVQSGTNDITATFLDDDTAFVEDDGGAPVVLAQPSSTTLPQVPEVGEDEQDSDDEPPIILSTRTGESAPLVLEPKAGEAEDSVEDEDEDDDGTAIMLTPKAAAFELPEDDLHTLSRPDDAPVVPLQTFDDLDAADDDATAVISVKSADVPGRDEALATLAPAADVDAPESAADKPKKDAPGTTEEEGTTPPPDAEEGEGTPLATAQMQEEASSTDARGARDARDASDASDASDEANAPPASPSTEAPAARMMVSGEYLSADSALDKGAGATSMYIPSSAVLEAVESVESSAQSDAGGEAFESGSETALTAAIVPTKPPDTRADAEAEEGGAGFSATVSAVAFPSDFKAPASTSAAASPAPATSGTQDVPALSSVQTPAASSAEEEARKEDNARLKARAKAKRKLGATVMFGMDLDALPGVSTPEGGVDENQQLGATMGVAEPIPGSEADGAESSPTGEGAPIPEDAGSDLSGFLVDGQSQSATPAVQTEAFLAPFGSTPSVVVTHDDPPAEAPKKSTLGRKMLQQTMAMDNVAEKMAEIVRMADQQQAQQEADEVAQEKADRKAKRRAMNQTTAMNPVEIQEWAAEMGMDFGDEVDEKIEDATARVAQAERAIDEGRFPEAIELYLSLLRAFPAETHYQRRLEDVWDLMKNRSMQSLELPAVPVAAPGAVDDKQLPWSEGQGKRLHLIWGSSVLLLLSAVAVLGFVWPGWFRQAPQSSGTPTTRRPAGPTLSPMQINSTPVGASIWLNGKDTGLKTPMAIKKKPGTYRLVLRMEGYRPLKKKIVLQPGMGFAVEFAMAPKEADPTNDPTIEPPRPVAVSPNPGRRKAPRRRVKAPTHTQLRLRSRPAGAAISLNDKFMGRKTPATLRLPVGRYQLQLQLRGYQTYIRDIRLSRKQQRLSVGLIRSNVKTRLSVTTTPPGASISIDGKAHSQPSPAVIGLSARTLVLSLSLKGYRPVNQKITLKEGETRRISVTMRKKGPANMTYVRAGHFWMGNNAGISREKPMRKVYMRGFSIDRYEVTVAEYSACVAAGRCKKAGRKAGCNGGKKSRSKHPINCVSWYDAVKYCRWKKKRLPTEAEWEKAARGKTPQLYPWGHGSPACKYAIFGRRCGFGTKPVGSRRAGRSSFGAYDMAGNVWEWVYDYFDRNYYKKAADKNPYNRFRGSGYRVIRGGAWNTRPDQVHVTYRLEFWPGRRTNSIGFRCAR